MDPWECYQDTWQTTCSVLEHHRDLMKVSRDTTGGGDYKDAKRGRTGDWGPTDLVAVSYFLALCEKVQPLSCAKKGNELGPGSTLGLPLVF